MGKVNKLRHVIALTSRMQVDYLRPVPLRIFVAAINPSEEEPLPPDADPMVFVNPVITPVGQDLFEDWEGCLSIPDLRGRVPRAKGRRCALSPDGTGQSSTRELGRRAMLAGPPR